MIDSKTIADLRTKYSGELARLEERQKSLDAKKSELMSKLGITDLEGFDIESEIKSVEGQMESLNSELQKSIEDYKKLSE